jgi:hypothetical protein
MHYKDFGYSKYNDFLTGPEWQELHDYFYRNCGRYRCFCGKYRFLKLHKRTYQHLTLGSLKRRFWYFKPLIVKWLKKHFVWLCSEHNGQVHFYDDGSRVPLNYQALLAREKEIKRRLWPWWKKLLLLGYFMPSGSKKASQ